MTITPLAQASGDAPAPQAPPVSVDNPPAASTAPEGWAVTSEQTLPKLQVNDVVPGTALLISALLMVLGLMGFLLYLCGLAQAKNCGHAVTLVLVGSVGGFLGFWTSGFGLVSGGVGDEHAGAVFWTSAGSFRDALNRELGVTIGSHFFGLMGNSGYFVTTANGAMAVPGLFLVQVSLLLFAIGGIVGAGMERSRLFPMVLCLFAVMAFVVPTVANWIWGGGWLADLGPNFKLGRGTFDLAGAGVVHESAGMCALALALIVGRRHFAAQDPSKLSPRRAGHNVPYFVVGTVLLCGSLAGGNLIVTILGDPDRLGIAALNTVLAGSGGMMATWILLWLQEKGRANPYRLGQGLIAGAVSVTACAQWFDGPIALLIGLIGGFIAGLGDQVLRRFGLDDPSSTISVQGMTGFWGVLAAGIFATSAAGPGAGYLYSGNYGQLLAQLIGALVIGVTTFTVSIATFWVVDLAMGLRVDLHEQEVGLDGSQTGALGYQGDLD